MAKVLLLVSDLALYLRKRRHGGSEGNSKFVADSHLEGGTGHKAIENFQESRHTAILSSKQPPSFGCVYHIRSYRSATHSAETSATVILPATCFTPQTTTPDKHPEGSRSLFYLDLVSDLVVPDLTCWTGRR